MVYWRVGNCVGKGNSVGKKQLMGTRRHRDGALGDSE